MNFSFYNLDFSSSRDKKNFALYSNNQSKGSPKELFKDKSPADVSQNQDKSSLLEPIHGIIREPLKHDFRHERESEKSIDVKKVKKRKVSIQSLKHHSTVLKSEDIKDKKELTKKRASVILYYFYFF